MGGSVTHTLICPWCDKESLFNEEDLSGIDVIVCKFCLKKSEPWADGDIDFSSWYLVKIPGN